MNTDMARQVTLFLLRVVAGLLFLQHGGASIGYMAQLGFFFCLERGIRFHRPFIKGCQQPAQFVIRARIVRGAGSIEFAHRRRCDAVGLQSTFNQATRRWAQFRPNTSEPATEIFHR